MNRLCISPDKRYLAAAGSLNVKLYDINSTNPNALLTFEGHTGNVTGVAFHHEGRWMVTSSEDGTVRIWETRTASVQRTYDHGSPANDVVIHPNQGEIISCDRSGAVRVWDLAENNCSHMLIPEEDVSVSSVTVASDGSLLCAANNSVCCLYLQLEKCMALSGTDAWLATVQGGTNPTSFTKQGNVFVWKLIQIQERTQLVPVTQFNAHSQYITRILLSPDVKKLATCSSDHTAKIWEVAEIGLDDDLNSSDEDDDDDDDLPQLGSNNAASSRTAGGPPNPHHHANLPHHFHPQGQYPTHHQNGAITNTSAATNPRMGNHPAGGPAGPSNAATGTAPPTGPVTRPYNLEAVLTNHQRWVWDCAFSADSAYLVTACSDHYARLWELGSQSIIRQYNGHHRGLVCVALNDYSESR